MRNHCALLTAAGLLLAGILAGCSDGGGDAQPEGPPAQQQKDQEAPESAGKAPEHELAKKKGAESGEKEQEAEATEQSAGELRVQPIDRNGLQQAIRGHRGNVVLVDFWATWCPPCIEAFPRIVELHREYDELVVVSVSMDDPKDAIGDVREFLAEHDPPFPTYILDVPEYTPFVRAMSDEWEGGLPAMFIYGRDGKRRHGLLGEHSIEEIRSRIEPLLRENPQGAEAAGGV